MREIKYRAWDKKFKAMFPVVWINWTINEVGLLRESDQFVFIRKFEEIEFLQFTGLPDKNSKEIYEGDIITFIWDNRKWTQKVIFSNCGFYPAQFDIGLGESPLINIEVIGNIYENPELLKGV